MIRPGGGTAAGAALVYLDVDGDLVGNRRRHDRHGLLDTVAKTLRRVHRRRVVDQVDGDAARRYGDRRIHIALGADRTAYRCRKECHGRRREGIPVTEPRRPWRE